MISADLFNRPNVLNIFTDASTKKVGHRTDVCYGAIVVCCDNIIDQCYKINYNSTVNNAEAKGVRTAYEFAAYYSNQYPVINIFSDSLITVRGVREWMFNWNCNKNNVLYNTCGQVKNSSVYLEILDIIVNNNLKVNLFHVKGHVDHRKIEDIKYATKVFADSNNLRNVRIGYDFIHFITKYNDIVDNTSRSVLLRDKSKENKVISPITMVPNDFYLKLYEYKKILKEVESNNAIKAYYKGI